MPTYFPVLSGKGPDLTIDIQHEMAGIQLNWEKRLDTTQHLKDNTFAPVAPLSQAFLPSKSTANDGFAHPKEIRIHTSVCCRRQLKSHTQSILVYEGPLKTRIKRVKLLSLTSSMMGFAMLPIVFKDLSQTSIALSCCVVFISSFFLSTPLLLDWITRRYVTQLRYESCTQLFTATTFNIICQQKELQFSKEDVTVPDLPGLLTSFQAKGISLFVDANQVKDPEIYSLMMGYDKPLDLKLSTEEKKDNVS